MTERLIAWAILLQTIELLQLRATFGVNGIWKWNILERDYSRTKNVMELFLSDRHFVVLLVLRLVTAATILVHPFYFAYFILLVTTLLVSQRWRGAFNGGSDAMTVVVLLGLCLPWPTAGLWYIAVQSALSYLMAGIAKVQERGWRHGKALPLLLDFSPYRVEKFKFYLGKRWISRIVSWVVIVFEISFPLALLHPQVAIVYICLGLTFHLRGIL